MANKPTTTIRIDLEVKDKANQIFDEFGLTLSSAVNAFLKAVIREKRMPFALESSNICDKLEHKNITLNKAFYNKKDEFYTTYEDVEKEMRLHKAQFANKTILCNCDDPFESAFFRFFVINFNEYKLKKLVSTCYKGSSFPKTIDASNKAYVAEITHVPAEINNKVDLNLLFNAKGNKLGFLAGDGDFRSSECIRLLEDSDVVVTNPPFSLFREYLNLLIDYKKSFLILGNMNAVTCKDVFPLFSENKVWYGDSIHSGDLKFFVPDDYPLEASSCGIDDEGRRFIRVKGIRWFTNMETKIRSIPVDFEEEFNPLKYPKYDNYNAIEVNKTKMIPKDYKGVMGVPISFLDKYCPQQFRILMLANGNARSNYSPDYLSKMEYRQCADDKGGVCMLNGKRTYARLLIQRIDNE